MTSSAAALSTAIADVARLGTVEIEDAVVKRLSSPALVERLVANGVSRLTAQRIVELERQGAGPGRARPHTRFK